MYILCKLFLSGLLGSSIIFGGGMEPSRRVGEMDAADSAESTRMIYEADERNDPCPPILQLLPFLENADAAFQPSKVMNYYEIYYIIQSSQTE